jgi:hypothetical protein
VCDGQDEGCKECNGGLFQIDGCPNEFCQKVITSIDMVDLFGKGLPPISGGVLDQSASFIEAVRFFESEEGKVRNERSSRNTD